MALRNRGKIKWNSALLFPEHVAMLREIRKDEERISDECPIEELEQKMLIAMEHTYTVKLRVWDCGL
ncbi:YolD-like family protein [Peribacillus frigoritolerans]|uniref:YolD-like family protein n=1 Tax=Peribacillus frigoritolerans TaxID=450367 RepID=UPI0013E29B85|nr:YolD-like family protein [Peribacillus frigoritolerans]